MITPGGSPGTSFTRSATTRFNNGQINAIRATMPHNAAAQQSLRNQATKKNKSGPPVGPSRPELPNLMASEPVQVPTGGPQSPPGLADEFDPKVFAENALDQIVGEIRTQQFLESPRVKDAMESIRLQNIMNQDNPRYRPDPRTLFEQVVSRVGMD